MKKILVMGLPGSGKTTFSGELKAQLETRNYTVEWFNADQVRQKYNDWDFSESGRIRQSIRMRELADSSNCDFVICDFVAPLPEMRNNFKADWTVWIDTINKGRYEDTNKMFVEPDMYDFRIPEQNAVEWAKYAIEYIVSDQRRPEFDWKMPTVQMLGRWQPWHPGHRALFERLLERTGQVIIQIRDVQGWQGSNPFASDQVISYIKRDLDPLYQGMYDVQIVPNIVHIGWGRGVGYTSGEETFDESITDISATKIRKEMGLE
jgi:adenylylsulfate kinase